MDMMQLLIIINYQLLEKVDDALALGKGFTSSVNAGVATNDFFSNFSGNSVNLDLTLANIGGQRKGFPTVEAHAYIIFVF